MLDQPGSRGVKEQSKVTGTVITSNGFRELVGTYIGGEFFCRVESASRMRQLVLNTLFNHWISSTNDRPSQQRDLYLAAFAEIP